MRVAPRAYPVLEAASGVRREWTTEPGSWLASLATPEAWNTIDIIRLECLRGMWGQRI